MGVHVLRGDDGQSCMYCSTTEWAFGPIFREGEEPEEFLKWLNEDPRHIPDPDLEKKVNEWRTAREEMEI